MNALVIAVASVAEIPPGEGREFEFAGERIAIFHTRGGRVYAIGATCPHRQGPLADGHTGGTTVVCPFHGWKFDLATGKGPDGCQVPAYHVEVGENGVIMLTLPQGDVEVASR